MDLKDAVTAEGAEPAPQPAAAEPRDERMVDIGGGISAPIWAVLEHADPDCRFCRKGKTDVLEADGKRHVRICGCGPRRLRTAIEAQRATVKVDQGDQFERISRRVELLTRQLTEETESLARREAAFNARIAAIEAEARGATALLQDASAQEIIAAHKMDGFASDIAEAEQNLATLRLLHEAAKYLLETSTRAKATAEATHAATASKLAAERERFSRDTAGARRDIAKLERRIALDRARAAGPDLGEETPAA